VEKLAHEYDKAGAEELNKEVANNIGTINTGLDRKKVREVEAYATRLTLPETDRQNWGLISPEDCTGLYEDIVETQKMNAPSPIASAPAVRYQIKGILGRFLIVEGIDIPHYKTNDHWGAPKINSSGGYEGDTLPTDGWGSTARTVLTKGMIIKIANVKMIQRFNDDIVLKTLQRFVVTEDATCNVNGQANMMILC